VHNDQLIHGFLVYTYCNMCYAAACFRETYIYMLNQTHIQDNMTDKEALLAFKYQVMNHTCTYNHRYYVRCAYYVVTITFVTMQRAIPKLCI
jgi:hypothetical protein